MKNSNLLIIALLAITVATSSSAYYLFTRSQISADTNDPGFPSVPGMAGFDPTTTPVQIPPVPAIPTSTPTTPVNVTSTVLPQSTATTNTNASTSSQSTDTSSEAASSGSDSSSNTSSSSTRRTIAGNSGSFTTTPTPSATASTDIAAIGIITETPIFTAVPELAAPTTKTGSNSTVWILIIVSLGAITGLGYVLFRKKPGQIGQMNTVGQAPVGSIPPESPATPQQMPPTPNPQPPAPVQTPPPTPNNNNQPPV